MAARDTRPVPWALSSLWSSKASSKCTAAIVDTVLFTGDDGGPKWLFTSKTGEVTKKRTCTAEAVQERFLRLSSVLDGNPHRRAGVLRFSDGSSKVVDEEGLKSLLSSWPPREANLVALQAYVASSGSQGTVYRNTYRLVNDKGRTTSLSHSFTTIPPSHLSSGNFQCSEPVLSRSKANRLNQTLDAAAKTIVRFLESTHKVRVVNTQVDFIVDTESQLWLSWIGDATVAVGDAVVDLSLAGVEKGKGLGRDSWLPPDARGEAGAGGTVGRRPGSRVRPRESPPAQEVNPLLMESVANAAEVVEAESLSERKEVLAKGPREKANDEERLAMGGAPLDPVETHAMRRTVGASGLGGDFSGLLLRDPKVLDLDKSGHLRLPTEEDKVLRVGDGEEDAVVGPAVLSKQSILRARKDQAERLQDSNAEPWREYPLTPTASKREEHAKMRSSRTTSTSLTNDRPHRRGLHSETHASESRKKWAEQRGELPGGTANYYSDVKVSQKDMQVYALLDRARRLRERQETLAKDEKARADASDFENPDGEAARRRRRGEAGLGVGRRKRSMTGSRSMPELPGYTTNAVSQMGVSIGSGDMGDHAEEQTLRTEEDMPLEDSMLGQVEAVDSGGHSVHFGGPQSPSGESGQGGSGGLPHEVKGGPKSWKDRLADTEAAEGSGGGASPAKHSAHEGEDGRSVAASVGSVAGTMNKFEKLDEYLRGKMDPLEEKRKAKREAAERTRAAQHKLREDGVLPPEPSLASTEGGSVQDGPADGLYFASVLICDPDESAARAAQEVLEEQGYYVDVEWDGRKCIELLVFEGRQYDALLIDRDSAVSDAFEVTEAIRKQERERRMARSKDIATNMLKSKRDTNVVVEPFSALPIIIYTDQVAADDLREYMEAGMDGCVSKPLDVQALLATMRAAAPQHAKALPDKAKNAASAKNGKNKGPQAFKMGALGVLEGSGEPMGSSAMAAQSLSLPSSFTAADGSVSGVLQLDADTTFPYTIIDFSMSRTGARPPTPERQKLPFFNLVVCHDIFDTLERTKIVLAPLAARYPGLQVLVWNYPGQAFSEWREEQLLNNDYLASCLHELLNSLGPQGTRQFDADKPFHLLGFGNGANVATFYACHYSNPSLRSILSLNGFAFIDPHLAGALHDCMNVFSCAPPARPDLPVYFYSRFLFSPGYLAQVSAPLALNLYTAVHNPITLEGRIQLCLGTLSHIDLRAQLAEIDLPIIAVQATQGALVKPVHSEVFVEHRRGGGDLSEAKTIHEALKNPHKTCVVWIKSGHELFQEARDQTVTLIEQMVTGYHETNDVSYLPAVSVDSRMVDKQVSLAASPARPDGHGNFEDAFIDNVLGKVKALDPAAGGGGRSAGGASSTTLLRGTAEFEQMEEQQRWRQYSNTVKQESITSAPGPGGGDTSGATTLTGAKKRTKRPRRRGAAGDASASQILDASVPSFERQDNSVYGAGAGSRIYPRPEEFPEVKEYMVWRLKRNKKRLQRLDQAARMVQGAFRSFLAFHIVRRLREARAAALIQRVYRGWKGRLAFLDHLRLLWASQVVQRAWRGFAGRKFFRLLRRMHAAAAQIQRVGRGFLGRLVAAAKREAQRIGALKMQQLFRTWKARRAMFALRRSIDSARTLQRVYRGHLGRRRATHEREKYLFSKSQSQGIEFGRQMLLEHKLHATRLQSEVQLLTQEKIGTEEQVEALLEEISEFEEAVTQLEKEMHDLSRIETEAVGVLDEEGRFELREQKMRLDREFGEMLAKIADRKDRLTGLEGKLAGLDRARQGKEEELRTLERKLVVLLDEQQRELESIKRRQAKKGQLLLKTQNAIAGGDPNMFDEDDGGGGGGGSFQGPSAADKRQAAQLMQSTETLMKFGFMSMSMTYFSSLNMIRAMRNVSATDTVMAALHENATNSVNARATGGFAGGSGGGAAFAGGDGGGGGGGNLATQPYDQKLGGGAFKPSLKPGQMPGDESLKVSAWSVEDVARWLQTLSLGQYREAFVDAAVDGSFLYDLNEDDLKNTLGMEHRLHRKKILSVVQKLKVAEAERNRQIQLHMQEERAAALGLPLPSQSIGDEYVAAQTTPGKPVAGGGASVAGASAAATLPSAASAAPSGAMGDAELPQGPPLKFDELAGWVRHTKVKKLKEVLDQLPSKPFDRQLVAAPYVEDFGTAYVEAYEREPFNLNKTDEHGNTLLTICAQNGSIKVARLLVEKGANPDHQNKEGQTPGHFANSYGLYDLLGWLYSDGGGDDTVLNKHNLSPYDGLRPDRVDEGAIVAT